MKNREESRTPAEEEFIELRPAAGAVPPFYSIIELMEGIVVPAEARRHPSVEQATKLAGRIMCWINDVLSWQKEDAFGDRHNLVMVFGESRELQRAEALRAAIEFCNDEVRQFVAATGEIPSFGTEADAAVATYTQALRAMIRVTLDWTYGSSRYHGDR